MPDTQDDVSETRVDIKTKVEVIGGVEEVELPFVMAVFSDLSGDSEKTLAPVDERAFTGVTKATLDDFLKSVAPALNLEVPDNLTDSGKTEMLRLVFNKLDDFRPEEIVKQGSLKKLKDLRDGLEKLAACLSGNPAQTALSDRLEEFKREYKRLTGNERTGSTIS